MKHLLFLLLLATSPAWSQSLTNLNLNYIYDPVNEVNVEFKHLRLEQSIEVYFEFTIQQSEYALDGYSVTWEKRNNYSQRSGEPLTPEIKNVVSTEKKTSGWIAFPFPEKPWILMIKIKNNATGKNWSYFTLIESKHPVNGFLQNKNQLVIKPYIDTQTEYTIIGSGSNRPLNVFYYGEKFPAGSPPFAENEIRVDRFLFADSTFSLTSGSSIRFKKEGLYLVQEDTASASGFAFRAGEASYPKYTRMEDLSAPMVLITTKEEYDQLIAAKNEKPKFDKVILDITGDKDRAKNFIRSYFRRIELANQYFTSYKEGWKTDRGMIYLIFGQPTEVGFNDNKEIWYYKNFNTRFTFVKSGSVYDPGNYVLLRDKRFAETWYNTIDLWRKSRF